MVLCSSIQYQKILVLYSLFLKFFAKDLLISDPVYSCVYIYMIIIIIYVAILKFFLSIFRCI